MGDKIIIILAYLMALMFAIRLLRIDTIHFKSAWIAVIASISVAIIGIAISIFI